MSSTESRHLFIVGTIAKKRKTLPYIKLHWREKIPAGYEIGFRVYSIVERRTFDLTMDSVLRSVYKGDGKFIGTYAKHSYDYMPFEQVYNDMLDSIDIYGIIVENNYADRIVNSSEYKVMYSLPDTDEMVAINMRGEIGVFSSKQVGCSGLRFNGWYGHSGKFKRGVDQLTDEELIEYFRKKSIVNNDSMNIINVSLKSEIDQFGRLVRIDTSGNNSDVYIPRGVTEIGDGTRYILDSSVGHIERLYIPKSVKRINRNALRCREIGRFIFEPNSELRDICDYSYAFYDSDVDNLPKRIEYIGKGNMCPGYSAKNIDISELHNLVELDLGMSEVAMDKIELHSGCYLNVDCIYSCKLKELVINSYVNIESRSIRDNHIEYLIIKGDFVSNGSPFLGSFIDTLEINTDNGDVHIPEMAFSSTEIRNIIIKGENKVYFGKMCFYCGFVHSLQEDEQGFRKMISFGDGCFLSAEINIIRISGRTEMGTGVFQGSTIHRLIYDKTFIPSYTFYQAIINDSNMDILGFNDRSEEHLILIGDYAFKDCKMTDDTNYINCGTVGKEAFSGYAFGNMLRPSDKKYITIKDSHEVRSKAFYNSDILGIHFEGTSKIDVGEKAFSRCTELSKISFETGDLTLGARAICDIPRLLELNLGKIVTIMDGNFECLPGLSRIMVESRDDYAYTREIRNYIEKNNIKHSSLCMNIVSY